jgi:hypothetical protein
VTHLIGEKPGIGWLWSIERAAEDALSDSRRRKGAKQILQALRAAREAIAYAKNLNDANSAEAQALAQAMAAVHLAWQAEVADRFVMIAPGVKQYEGQRRENQRRKEAAEVLRNRWRKRANRILLKNPRMSKSAVAKKIDPTRWSTIRKHI